MEDLKLFIEKTLEYDINISYLNYDYTKVYDANDFFRLLKNKEQDIEKRHKGLKDVAMKLDPANKN